MAEMDEYTVLGSMEYIRRYVRPSHREATPPCELQQKMNLAQLKGRAIKQQEGPFPLRGVTVGLQGQNQTL